MGTNQQRIEEFKQEIAALDLRPPEDRNERRWLLAGLVLPALGLLAIVIAWWGASGTPYVADQIPYLISGGMIGVGLIVVGAALFVRYSLTRYLRFWLLRSLHEQRVQTDRTVDALERIEALLRTTTRPRAGADQ